MKFFKVYRLIEVPKEHEDETPAHRCVGIFKNRINADNCAAYLEQKYDNKTIVLFGKLTDMDHYYITHKVVKFSDCKEEIIKLNDEYNHIKHF